jgi:hypothetical protein
MKKPAQGPAFFFRHVHRCHPELVEGPPRRAHLRWVGDRLASNGFPDLTRLRISYELSSAASTRIPPGAHSGPLQDSTGSSTSSNRRLKFRFDHFVCMLAAHDEPSRRAMTRLVDNHAAHIGVFRLLDEIQIEPALSQKRAKPQRHKAYCSLTAIEQPCLHSHDAPSAFAGIVSIFTGMLPYTRYGPSLAIAICLSFGNGLGPFKCSQSLVA